MITKPIKKTALQWAADLEKVCGGNEPLLGWAASLVYSRYFGSKERSRTEREACPLRALMKLYRSDHVLTDEDLRPVLLAAGCDPKYVASQCRPKVTSCNVKNISHGATRLGKVKVTAGVKERSTFSTKRIKTGPASCYGDGWRNS